MHQKNHEDQHNNDSIQHELKKENIVEVVIKQEIDTGEDISEEITIQNNLKKEDDPDMEMNKQFKNKKLTQKIEKKFKRQKYFKRKNT